MKTLVSLILLALSINVFAQPEVDCVECAARLEGTPEVSIDTKIANTALNNELVMAAKYCDKDRVNSLIENGADINAEAKDANGNGMPTFPIYKAVKNCDRDFVKFLVEDKGADLSVRRQSLGTTPLVVAARWNEDVAIYLVEEAKMNVNESNAAGRTPLLVAVNNKHNKLLKVLLSNKNLNLNQGVVFGARPLSQAVQYENLEAFHMILHHPENTAGLDKRSIKKAENKLIYKIENAENDDQRAQYQEMLKDLYNYNK